MVNGLSEIIVPPEKPCEEAHYHCVESDKMALTKRQAGALKHTISTAVLEHWVAEK